MGEVWDVGLRKPRLSVLPLPEPELELGLLLSGCFYFAATLTKGGAVSLCCVLSGEEVVVPWGSAEGRSDCEGEGRRGASVCVQVH